MQTERRHDSRVDTYRHIEAVRMFLCEVIIELMERQRVHDATKLHPPEVELFDQWTPKLAALTYGSPEYEEARRQLEPALRHHYRENRHHPEHFDKGIRGMNLVDVIEMLCDWKAATLRHNDGDIRKSIELNQKRFGYSDDLKEIFLNTVRFLEGDD